MGLQSGTNEQLTLSDRSPHMLLQILTADVETSWTGAIVSLKRSHERGPPIIPMTSGGETEAQGERKAPQGRGSGPALGPDFPKPVRLLAPQIGSASFAPCTMLPFRRCWLS